MGSSDMKQWEPAATEAKKAMASSKALPLMEQKPKQKRRLIATEMDFWRRRSGISRMDHVRNDTIRELMGVEKTLMDTIETKRLQWYGHLEKMDGNR
ncbi:hypothetical protein ILUMI_04937 [Ignelater luminosus]|uniref:Uncharacterized protein n=1 Tax=Ignelater luminosus TaxID=2038154 RepID=A0A8K0GJ43_IGNLU|nr:hypothetical protein ILUMI_04937 [Ignelater luminosus]